MWMHKTWLLPCSIWRCFVTTVWVYKGLYGENNNIIMDIIAEIVVFWQWNWGNVLNDLSARISNNVKTSLLLKSGQCTPWSGFICSPGNCFPSSNVSMEVVAAFPGWLAGFNSELCSVRYGDEFCLEFNWKGAVGSLESIVWNPCPALTSS